MGFKRLLYIGSVALLLLGAAVYLGHLPWFVLLLALFAALAIVVFGASRIGSGFFLPAATHYPSSEKQIAITFDDGPDPDFTLAVATLIEKYGGRSTFFCIGRRVEEHPELVRQLHERGHQVGNHSFSHATWIDFKTKRGWLNEIQKTDEVLSLAVNNYQNKLFRPPYGVTTPHLAAAIRELGHRVVGWRVRPYDTAVDDPARIANRILKKTKPGDIILLHDTHPRIIPALEQLLPILVNYGFKFVTVEELARDV